MTLHLEQFRYGGDNLAYLVFGEREALAVDGGAWVDILSCCKKRGLTLVYVTNTHGHYDHTLGDSMLLDHSRARFLAWEDLPDNGQIVLDGRVVTIYRTPGHTVDSVSFHFGKNLLTGDTLFNGTVGNCFSGDLDTFYRSLKRLAALPGETRIFAGHDYVREAVAAAKTIEPNNPHPDRFLKHEYDPGLVYSTLADEFLINPYLRLDTPSIVSLLASLGLPRHTAEERWRSLMSLD